MAGHTNNVTGREVTASVTRMDFSFVTNGNAAPVGNISLSTLSLAGGNLWRGEGVLTITHAHTGTYLVTLDAQTSYRYCIAKTADLEDLTYASTPTGGWATIGPIVGEAGATSTSTPAQISFFVYTWANSSGVNTLTDYTGQRLSVAMAWKDGGTGK